MKPLLFILAGLASFGTPLRLLNAGSCGAALLLQRALNERQQSQMYAYLCANARGTQEWQNLQVDAGSMADVTSGERPLPLLVHKHPYTLKSNGAAPSILTWARQFASYAARKVATADGLALRDERARLARDLRAIRPDSLVSILYRARGALPPHMDHGLEGLGLAVSFGGSCEFRYGDEVVELHSGDALFGRFGSVEHEVVSIRPVATGPAWWRELPAAPGPAGEISRFGRARCSLQIRKARDRRRIGGLSGFLSLGRGVRRGWRRWHVEVADRHESRHPGRIPNLGPAVLVDAQDFDALFAVDHELPVLSRHKWLKDRRRADQRDGRHGRRAQRDFSHERGPRRPQVIELALAGSAARRLGFLLLVFRGGVPRPANFLVGGVGGGF